MSHIPTTPEEILAEATKNTINIIPNSPLHKAIIFAMKEYADQFKPEEDEELYYLIEWPESQQFLGCHEAYETSLVGSNACFVLKELVEFANTEAIDLFNEDLQHAFDNRKTD